MPHYRPLADTSPLDRTSSNIVDEGVGSHHNPNVPEPFSSQIPGHQISGGKGSAHHSTMALKEFLKIGNAPVINIPVSPSQAPQRRISLKVTTHVFMNALLKIHA